MKKYFVKFTFSNGMPDHFLSNDGDETEFNSDVSLNAEEAHAFASFENAMDCATAFLNMEEDGMDAIHIWSR